MDVGDQLVGIRGDDGEGSDPFARSGFFPVLPNASYSERTTVLHGNGKGLLRLLALDSLPLKNPSTGTMQRRLRYASRNVGRFGTVSHFALIGFRPPFGSLHQYGISPHRNGSSDTSPVWSLLRMPSPP